MAGQRGRDVLIRLGDGAGSETFETVAGIRTKAIKLNAETVDGTSADSSGGWRELIAGAGVRDLRVEGAGVFKDAASDARLREAFFAAHHITAELIVPDFGRFTGPFQVEDLSYSGAHDGEAQFSIKLASAGAIEFAALP